MKHILQSTLTADGVVRVVLHKSHSPNELVTHLENVQTGGYSHGNYFPQEEKHDGEMAIRDFLARCKLYHVQPSFEDWFKN